MQIAFSHIFSGGYSSGYYSYNWAMKFVADSGAEFEEEGMLNQDLGRSFLKSVLERGSSRPMA